MPSKNRKGASAESKAASAKTNGLDSTAARAEAQPVAQKKEDQEEGEDMETPNKERKHDSGAADLEKVTDYVEEKEITTQDIQAAMKLVNEKKATEAAKKAAREKELLKVKVSEEDIKMIAHEMEISRSVAERKLREHNGNAVETLIDLTQ